MLLVYLLLINLERCTPPISCSYSDSEQESDLMAAVGQLSQRLARQKEELDQLRAEQQDMLISLKEKLDAMTAAIVVAQRDSLAEHAKEQRILISYMYTC